MNRPLTFSLGLARTFTRPASMPLGAAVGRDPYASHGLLKCVLAILVLLAVAAGVCWKVGCWPFSCCGGCGAATEQTAAPAAESAGAKTTATPPAGGEAGK